MGKQIFVDVVLPIPLERKFTYLIDEEPDINLVPGMRVAVPFGKSKIYTGIAYSYHDDPPTAYEAKAVYEFLDAHAIITETQMKHWEWMADYYMCTLGEIIRAAIPGPFLLESETIISRQDEIEVDENNLSDKEFTIWECLGNRKKIRVDEVAQLLERKNVLPILQNMLGKGLVTMQEKLVEQYRPKKVHYLKLNPEYRVDENLNALFETLGRAPKQREALLKYFQMDTPVLPFNTLEKSSGISRGVIKALVDKGVLDSFYEREDRIQFSEIDEAPDLTLNKEQEIAVKAIDQTWRNKTVALLDGVTSSGKTELYIHLIKQVREEGKQVLYLVPEIALTAQLINRLLSHFGNQIAVFHSKYSQMERVETWNNILNNTDTGQIVLGARSALFMPFRNLGLIVVDEEHDASYKQFDPAPRYHARDSAIALAEHWGCKVILGSATPSVESYYNVNLGKYGLARIKGRYGKVVLPEINLVNLAEARRKKTLKGHFSVQLYEAISNTLKSGAQVILFQNRRGFSPVITCLSCGHVPQCGNCDVSLTYHRFNQTLRCHYCGYHEAVETTCAACGNPTLDTIGLGTQQVAEELKDFFPEARIARMDYDTTRGKNAYQNIIKSFEDHEIDVLVGTQMVTKGLDFRRVNLVGVMNADTLLNFPDFKAHERCYQLLTQVAGRAGRTDIQGLVMIQTYNPEHPILNHVINSDYHGMYQSQIREREQFNYPPVNRLIRITFKHKNYLEVNTGASWFASALRQVLEQGVLGPESPAIGRIRNQYIKHILIKFPRTVSPQKIKNSIKGIGNSFNAISRFRSIRVIYDVDYL